LDKFEKADDTPEVSAKVQDLIKSQFSFSDNKDKAALEGAMALAKFGQFQRALEEFQQMIDVETIRVEAAKNVLRCHMALFTVDEAIAQYGEWIDSDKFTSDELEKVHVFFESTLQRSGIDTPLPEISKPAVPDAVEDSGPDMGEATIEMPDLTATQPQSPGGGFSDVNIPEIDDDEILDINSMEFVMGSRPDDDQQVELNVSFQNGDVISILIPGRDRDIIDFLEPGQTLNEIQFYSPMAIFSGSGEIQSRTKIESGPRRGDYNVDIQVLTK
jgi:hypothetical protein